MGDNSVKGILSIDNMFSSSVVKEEVGNTETPPVKKRERKDAIPSHFKPSNLRLDPKTIASMKAIASFEGKGLMVTIDGVLSEYAKEYFKNM